MKKIYLILLTVFLNMALFSCTPQASSDLEPAATGDGQECCGDGGNIPPPPPQGTGG